MAHEGFHISRKLCKTGYYSLVFTIGNSFPSPNKGPVNCNMLKMTAFYGADILLWTTVILDALFLLGIYNLWLEFWDGSHHLHVFMGGDIMHASPLTRPSLLVHCRWISMGYVYPFMSHWWGLWIGMKTLPRVGPIMHICSWAKNACLSWMCFTFMSSWWGCTSLCGWAPLFTCISLWGPPRNMSLWLSMHVLWMV